MKVICAGLAKTGTTSLVKALQVLGYNVYDIDEHGHFHRQEWLDSFETDRHPNFKEIYKGVDGVADIPPAFWFQEISAAFPEAKVILTVRDSEDAWLKSFKEHLQLMPFYAGIVPWMRKHKRFFDLVHQAIFGNVNPEATAIYRVKYRQHNERVQAVIPAEKLLVFNVKQGWKPLCKFLGCDVPSTPFPRANVGQSDTKRKVSEWLRPERSVAFFILFVVFLVAAVFLVHFIG